MKDIYPPRVIVLFHKCWLLAITRLRGSKWSFVKLSNSHYEDQRQHITINQIGQLTLQGLVAADSH